MNLFKSYYSVSDVHLYVYYYGSKECLMLHKWYEHFLSLSKQASLLSCWNLCTIIETLPLLLNKSVPINFLWLISVQRITSMWRSLEPSWQSRVRNNVVWSSSNHLVHAWQLLAVLLLHLPLERGWGQCATACAHTHIHQLINLCLHIWLLINSYIHELHYGYVNTQWH